MDRFIEIGQPRKPEMLKRATMKPSELAAPTTTVEDRRQHDAARAAEEEGTLWFALPLERFKSVPLASESVADPLTLHSAAQREALSPSTQIGGQ